MKLIKGMAVALACCGMAAPTTALMAAGLQAAPKAAQGKTTVQDIALSENGAFSGQIVDAQGHALDGATVSIRHAGKEIARTVTAKDGRFQVTKLRGGLHEVVAANNQSNYRFWTKNTAPPAARAEALVVAGTPTVARGQGPLGLDAITLGLIGTSTGALVMTIVNNGEIDDLKDDNASLRNQVDDLQDTLDQILQSNN